MTNEGTQRPTYLPIQAYKGRMDKENMKKHRAMLFFLPIHSTASRASTRPETNMRNIQ